MNKHSTWRTATWIAVCSAWPQAIPITWYAREVSTLRQAVTLGMQSAARPSMQAKTNPMLDAMASSFTSVGVKFVVSMLLLSILVCVIVLRRRSRGIPASRVAVDVALMALAVGVLSIIPALIRSGMDFGRVLSSPATLFPIWAVAAAGLTFLMTLHSAKAHRVAA
jgi:hypothetical protein